MDGIPCEMLYQTVEHFNCAAVSDRHVRSNKALPYRPSDVDSISYLGFLKDSQVQWVYIKYSLYNQIVDSLPNP